jgi:hypothetical protein
VKNFVKKPREKEEEMCTEEREGAKIAGES